MDETIPLVVGNPLQPIVAMHTAIRGKPDAALVVLVHRLESATARQFELAPAVGLEEGLRACDLKRVEGRRGYRRYQQEEENLSM